ncbi:hypothetical protein [Nocardioides sp. GCM10028917]|uniref:hypothetical protein n=1 Tax=Nocardioides sp. GCM10028917 TaxID=3273408 RepID=UPI003672BD38
MLRKHARRSVVALGTAALILGWSPTAHADQVFHTTQYPLSSVAGESTHGWVIDVHTEGPRIYAQERYLLRDVDPGQTYVVNLYAYSDLDCGDIVVAVPGMATMTANASGNAHGAATFVPAAVEDLPRTTYYLRWQVTDGSGAAAYQTDCVAVALD